MRYIFESYPVTAAIIVILAALLRYRIATTYEGKLSVVWIAFNAFLLIFAQAAWWKSFLIDNDLMGTDAANVIWTIFNSSVMTLYLFAMLVPFRKIKEHDYEG